MSECMRERERIWFHLLFAFFCMMKRKSDKRDKKKRNVFNLCLHLKETNEVDSLIWTLDKFKVYLTFRMKLLLVLIVLCMTIYLADGIQLLASSSRQLNRRETKLVRRLVKRQTPSGRRSHNRWDSNAFFLLIQVRIVIVERVMYPTVERILLRQLYRENAVRNVFHGSMRLV